MAHPRLPIVLLLTTLAVILAQSPTNITTLKCPRVGFQYFFKNLNQSVTYRVAMNQQQNQNQDSSSSTLFGYQNASVSFVRTAHSAFLVFNCQRSTGTTCDVFTAWRDADTGDLRAIRNVLNLALFRSELENTLSIEKQTGLYFWCDPHRLRRSRFALIPIDGDGGKDRNGTDTESTTTTTVCSAEHGNGYAGDAEECDLEILEKLLIHNDLKATEGLNKRALLMSIVLMALVGMTLIAIIMAQWMNKSQRLVAAK